MAGRLPNVHRSATRRARPSPSQRKQPLAQRGARPAKRNYCLAASVGDSSILGPYYLAAERIAYVEERSIMKQLAFWNSAALLVSLLMADPGHAAVRICGNFIDSFGEGQTEKEAKKNALSSWMKSAETLGIEWTSWRLADGCLTCIVGGQIHRCKARARPCVIKHVPPKDWQAMRPAEAVWRARNCP